jgi:chorismate-pyruvate lyase
MPEATAESPTFDPTRGVFTKTAQRPASLAPVDVASLAPVERALLVIDGTVTKFLEAYFLEPVSVERLAQAEDRATGFDAEWLDCDPGEPLLRRSVLLRGGTSSRVFAWADSLLLPARLSSSMRRALETEPGGLGRIIIDSKLETRRECLWFGWQQVDAAQSSVAAGRYLVRSYRILSGGQPLMMVTERFPEQ